MIAQIRLSVFILIFLHCMIVFSQKFNCPIYKCSEENLGNAQCINYYQMNGIDYNEISLNCKEGTVCNYIDYPNSNVPCTLKPIIEYVDGEPCKENKNCASKACDSGKCVGKAEKETCNKDTECAIGLYCAKSANPDIKTCMKQLNATSSCTAEFECQNNMGCYMNSTCVKYFSLDDGIQTNDERFCKHMKIVHGYCALTARDQVNEECTADEKSQQKSCKFQVQGVPAELVKDYQEPCACSRGINDKMFCPLGSEDRRWNDMALLMKDYYYNEAFKFHTVKRNQMNYLLKKKVLPLQRFPLYEKADHCALDIDAGEGYIQTSLVILIALIFLFLRE